MLKYRDKDNLDVIHSKVTLSLWPLLSLRGSSLQWRIQTAALAITTQSLNDTFTYKSYTSHSTEEWIKQALKRMHERQKRS